MSDLTLRRIKRLLIECPDSVKSGLNAPDSIFEPGLTNPHYLLLSLSPKGSEYRRTNNRLADNQPFSIGNNSIVVSPSSISREIEVKVAGCPVALFDTIEELVEISESNAQPIRLFDYCKPERSDRKATPVGVEPRTERLGFIEIDQVGAEVGQPGDEWLHGGFSCKFFELAIR